MTPRQFLLPTSNFLLLLCLIGSSVSAAADDIGVLVLAHGGSERWNQAVKETVAQAGLASATEMVFGMGMHPREVQALQAAVDRLEQRGVTRIVVVPLLISSASEVMRQFQYLLGLRPDGPWPEHVKPVTIHVARTMTSTLFDDPPVVTEVLLERALELSRTPREETVVLVAHGPNGEEENRQWLIVMEGVAKQLQQRGQFRSVIPVTMRDDAPRPIQTEATRQMRALVRQHSGHGRVLVVPVLLAQGGIETKIPRRLRGLTYAYRGKTLLPHPTLARWIAEHVQRASASGADASHGGATGPSAGCPPCAARGGQPKSIVNRP